MSETGADDHSHLGTGEGPFQSSGGERVLERVFLNRQNLLVVSCGHLLPRVYCEMNLLLVYQSL